MLVKLLGDLSLQIVVQKLKYKIIYFWPLHFYAFEGTQKMNFTLADKIRCAFKIFWRFPPIFVFFKLTCLVTLFDRNLQVFKKPAKIECFWHF